MPAEAPMDDVVDTLQIERRALQRTIKCTRLKLELTEDDDVFEERRDTTALQQRILQDTRELHHLNERLVVLLELRDLKSYCQTLTSQLDTCSRQLRSLLKHVQYIQRPVS